MNIFDIVRIHPYAPQGVAPHDWDYARFEGAIHRMLRRLLANRYGQIVLDQIVRNAGSKTILMDPDDGYFRHGKSMPNCVPSWGGDVTIHFLPAPWRSPDSVLLHELVHALGYFAFGMYDPRKEWEFETLPPPFHAKGELIATAVANLYRLDESHATLRVGYDDDTRWVTPGDASFEFAAVLEVFEEFAGKNPPLTRRLAQVLPRGYGDHRYNPFRWVGHPGDIAKKREGVRERERLDALFAPPA